MCIANCADCLTPLRTFRTRRQETTMPIYDTAIGRFKEKKPQSHRDTEEPEESNFLFLSVSLRLCGEIRLSELLPAL